MILPRACPFTLAIFIRQHITLWQKKAFPPNMHDTIVFRRHSIRTYLIVIQELSSKVKILFVVAKTVANSCQYVTRCCCYTLLLRELSSMTLSKHRMSFRFYNRSCCAASLYLSSRGHAWLNPRNADFKRRNAQLLAVAVAERPPGWAGVSWLSITGHGWFRRACMTDRPDRAG